MKKKTETNSMEMNHQNKMIKNWQYSSHAFEESQNF